MKSKPAPKRKKLHEIQRAFATGVMRPLTRDYRMQAKWVDGKSARQAAAKLVKPNDRLNSFERLEIYNKQYWFRLLDSLHEDFPALRALIGEERFQAMSIAYLKKYPSKSYTLRDLGNRLEKFLVQEPRWMAAHPRLGLDLVRLEWAHIEAFDGDERPPLGVDALLDGRDPAKLRLGIQPHVTLLACEYGVDDFVVTVRRREEPAGEASNAVSEKRRRKAEKKMMMKMPKPEKVWLAVHRSDFSVWYKRLEKPAYVLLKTLKKGATLEKACERAARVARGEADFSVKLQEWFAQWSQFGWFCRAYSCGGQ